MTIFEWKNQKANANKKKHGVSFEEAKSVFYDDFAIQFFDTENSNDEERFLMLGKSHLSRFLLVCHCEKNEGEVVRIISARKATAKERKLYRGDL